LAAIALPIFCDPQCQTNSIASRLDLTFGGDLNVEFSIVGPKIRLNLPQGAIVGYHRNRFEGHFWQIG
jgi:hypothetical protein